MKYIVGFFRGAGFILAIVVPALLFIGVSFLLLSNGHAYLESHGMDGDIILLIYFVVCLVVFWGGYGVWDARNEEKKKEPWE